MKGAFRDAAPLAHNAPLPRAPAARPRSTQARAARALRAPAPTARRPPAAVPRPTWCRSSNLGAHATATDVARPPMDVVDDSEFGAFMSSVRAGATLVPLYERLFSDQLTPVQCYRCLVSQDDREIPSFLLESVVGGSQSGRFSFVGARPALEVVAKGNAVTVLDHERGTRTTTTESDPLAVPQRLSAHWKPGTAPGMPDAPFTGGWVGFTSYDAVRYAYPAKLPFASAPPDDRGLPDLHLALYKDVVVFDTATKLAYIVTWVDLATHDHPTEAFASGRAQLEMLSQRMMRAVPLSYGRVGPLSLGDMPPPAACTCNMTPPQFRDAVLKAKEHILAGDAFQIVLSQRFERATHADPFEVYRALRVVNPSPYMIYLQGRGAIFVASSPEILCRVSLNADGTRTVVNRPLAGTRPRGRSPESDVALESELLSDAKETAEHVMLVDLGRNDVGKVCVAGSVRVPSLMAIERYSHVMHISSTVTGTLRPELSAWDALRAALPAGTVSGAPKVSAMAIIDKLEVARRGPYGGGIGWVSFQGGMDIALALRTMVIPTHPAGGALYAYAGGDHVREWTVHIQAGAGLVADSDPAVEYQETVNKAAALARAVDLAEAAFVDPRASVFDDPRA